jgi:hypothetical protein
MAAKARWTAAAVLAAGLAAAAGGGAAMWSGNNGAGGDGEPGDRFAELRARMVDEQLRRRGIDDPRVLAAMAEVPRHEFVPAGNRDEAYADRPLPIGWAQTISQPYIVITKPMWATDENAIRRFMSVWARQPSAP